MVDMQDVRVSLVVGLRQNGDTLEIDHFDGKCQFRVDKGMPKFICN